MSGSTVRFPQELLSRAEEIDAEDRSRVLREAAKRGIELMENEKAAQDLKDQRAMLLDAVRSDPETSSWVRSIAVEVAGQKDLRSSILPMRPRVGDLVSDDHVFCLPEDDEMEVVVNPTSWMIYRPFNIQVWCSGDPKDVEISELRQDNGNGTNLLLPGWHSAASVNNGVGSLVVRRENIVAPSNLCLKIRSKSSMDVAVTIQMDVVDDGLTVDQSIILFDPDPADTDLVRVPFQVGPGREGRTLTGETLEMNGCMLQVAGVVFEPVYSPADLFRIEFRDLMIGGSPMLLCGEGWHAAADFGPEMVLGRSALRMNPVLFSPNRAYMDVRVRDEEVRDTEDSEDVTGLEDLVQIYLICRVLYEDDES